MKSPLFCIHPGVEHVGNMTGNPVNVRLCLMGVVVYMVANRQAQERQMAGRNQRKQTSNTVDIRKRILSRKKKSKPF